MLRAAEACQRAPRRVRTAKSVTEAQSEFGGSIEVKRRCSASLRVTLPDSVCVCLYKQKAFLSFRGKTREDGFFFLQCILLWERGGLLRLIHNTRGEEGKHEVSPAHVSTDIKDSSHWAAWLRSTTRHPAGGLDYWWAKQSWEKLGNTEQETLRPLVKSLPPPPQKKIQVIFKEDQWKWLISMMFKNKHSRHIRKMYFEEIEWHMHNWYYIKLRI